MRLHLSVLFLVCLCSPPYQAVNAIKSDVDEVKQQNDHETTESTSLFETLDSVSETLLEKSTKLINEFYDFTQGIRNAANKKMHLHYLKQKAGHLREDIENEIEVQRKNAWAAEEKIEKLTKVSEQLKSIDRLAKRTGFPEMQSTKKPYHQKSSKNQSTTNGKSSAKSSIKTTTSQPKQTQSSTTQSPDNATIPIAGFGLGDGFGRHTR